VAGAAYAFFVDSESGTWRYKITINVQTPDGIKSGSAVREVSNSFTDIGAGLPEATNKPDIQGEAVIVDLGEKGKLYGLINSGSHKELSTVFPYTKAEGIADEIRHYKNLPVGKTGELTDKRYWPQMVTFEDLLDPMCVQAVNKEDISETFGEGYAIDSIMIEVTDKPVTHKIDDTLKFSLDQIISNWRVLENEEKTIALPLQHFKRQTQ
jgi:hypothetical protein